MGDHCPKLEYLDTYDSGYMSAHPHFENNNKPYENNSLLWTEDEKYSEVLDVLLADLTKKAGGVSQYPANDGRLPEGALKILQCQGIS